MRTFSFKWYFAVLFLAFAGLAGCTGDNIVGPESEPSNLVAEEEATAGAEAANPGDLKAEDGEAGKSSAAADAFVFTTLNAPSNGQTINGSAISIDALFEVHALVVGYFTWKRTIEVKNNCYGTKRTVYNRSQRILGLGAYHDADRRVTSYTATGGCTSYTVTARSEYRLGFSIDRDTKSATVTITPPTPPASVGISGPYSVQLHQTATWSAWHDPNDPRSYSYKWYTRTPGGSWYLTSGRSQSYTTAFHTPGIPYIDLKVEATSGGTTVSATRRVIIN